MAVVARSQSDFKLANCQVSDGVGSLVYISGDRVGMYYQVATVDPSDRLKMPAVGVIIQKITPTTCVVQTGGDIDGVYTGLTPGELLFAGDGGGLDDEMPVPSGSPRYVQTVGVSLGNNVFRFTPDLIMTRRRA